MRCIQVTDCRVLSFDSDCVYATLIDFGSYPQWWPRELRLKVPIVTADVGGSRFEVQSVGVRLSAKWLTL